MTIRPRLSRSPGDAASRLLTFTRLAAAMLLATSAAVCVTGCDNASDDAAAIAPPAPLPSPEMRFERLMSELRRRIEGQSGPTNSTRKSGGTTYTGGYEVVRGEMAKPETDGGVYRAVVEIKENANILVINLPAETATPEEPTTAADPLAGLDEPFAPVVESEGRVGPIAPSPIESRSHTDSHLYELTYVEGRWRLKTAVDPTTFLAAAFKMALDRQ